jgi:hypothetical protein
MAWFWNKKKTGQSSTLALSASHLLAMESLEDRLVLASDLAIGELPPIAGFAAGTQAGALLFDVSNSMTQTQSIDVNNDGQLTNLDDVNDDGIKGTPLDLALNQAIGLIDARALPENMAFIIFGKDASALDMSPDPGIQQVGSIYKDLNGNGVSDGVDMLRSMKVGQGGIFHLSVVNASRTFYDAPLQVLENVIANNPEYDFNFAINNAAAIPTLPVTNPNSGTGTTINNGVSPDTVGYFSMTVGDGGFSTNAQVTAQGVTEKFTNENFLFQFSNFVDFGDPDGPVDLSQTDVSTEAARVTGQNAIRSEGSFSGPNGTVNWTVTTSIIPGTTRIINTVQFTSDSALGDINLSSYLDEDIQNFTDDIMVLRGTPGSSDFQVFTLDGPQRVGFSQSGVYANNGTTQVNATYNGWAANTFNQLQQDIIDGTQSFSVPGTIDTTNLPSFTDPQLGQAYGPGDVTTAFRWTVDPTATTATITSFLTLIPANPVIAGSAFLYSDGGGLLGSSNTTINSLGASGASVSSFLVGQYVEVGSVTSIARIAAATGGAVTIASNPTIVDNASVPLVIPSYLGNLGVILVGSTLGITSIQATSANVNVANDSFNQQAAKTAVVPSEYVEPAVPETSDTSPELTSETLVELPSESSESDNTEPSMEEPTTTTVEEAISVVPEITPVV